MVDWYKVEIAKDGPMISVEITDRDGSLHKASLELCLWEDWANLILSWCGKRENDAMPVASSWYNRTREPIPFAEMGDK